MKYTQQEQVILSAFSGKQLSCAEIAEETGIGIESVRSVVRTLYRHGFLSRTRVKHIPGGIGSGAFHFNYGAIQ